MWDLVGNSENRFFLYNEAHLRSRFSYNTAQTEDVIRIVLMFS